VRRFLPKQSHCYLPLIDGIASSLRSSQRHERGVFVQALNNQEIFLNSFIFVFLIIMTANYSDKLSASLETIYHIFDIRGAETRLPACRRGVNAKKKLLSFNFISLRSLCVSFSRLIESLLHQTFISCCLY